MEAGSRHAPVRWMRQVVAIPDDWRPPVPGDFKKKTMESLSDLGRKMGADPNSWRVRAAPSRPDRAKADRE